ncbi:hypothetical protein BGZ90_002537, partial [Linnemannia elongata]
MRENLLAEDCLAPSPILSPVLVPVPASSPSPPTPPIRPSPFPYLTDTPPNTPALTHTPITPSPLTPDSTDRIFERAVDNLDETCRKRLLRPAAEYNAEILRITNETRKKQTTENKRYATSKAYYRKQLAKSPQNLAIALSTLDTQAANAAARIKSLSSRLKTVALGIRRQATEAINEYRLCRLALLREDLETRLIRKAEDSRLRESLQDKALQLRQQHHLVTSRLQEFLQAEKLQETESLRQQHHQVVSRLQEIIQTRKLQQHQKTEALRQQHQVIVSRLKEIRPRPKETTSRYKPAFDTSISFPLQECYQVQPPSIARPLTTQIGPLCLSPTEAASIRMIQDTPVNNSTPRVIYSDGSLLNSGTSE